MPGATRGWRMHPIVERIGLRCVCEAQARQVKRELAAPNATSRLRASPTGRVGCGAVRQHCEHRSIEQAVLTHCIPLAQPPPQGGRPTQPYMPGSCAEQPRLGR